MRSGTLGATVIAAAFILPSFVMVLALAAFYVRFGGLPWMQGAFYGIGAAVIAIILRSAIKLVRKTVAKDWLLWAILAVNGIVTAWTEHEIVWVFALSGLLALLIKAPPHWGSRTTTLAFSGLPPWFMQGIHGVAAWPTLGRVAVYFGEAGVFVFGSGLAIVPFLRGGVVEQFHWLNDPPHYRRFAENRSVKAFVNGVTAAACGAIAGAAFVLGRRAITDVPTAAMFVIALMLLCVARKLPEPVLILAAGVAGLVLKASGL